MNISWQLPQQIHGNSGPHISRQLIASVALIAAFIKLADFLRRPIGRAPCNNALASNEMSVIADRPRGRPAKITAPSSEANAQPCPEMSRNRTTYSSRSGESNSLILTPGNSSSESRESFWNNSLPIPYAQVSSKRLSSAISSLFARSVRRRNVL
jgi:hypothetical protein